MSKTNDGGPAFPVSAAPVFLLDGSCQNDGFTNEGMSLRDYFAAHAPSNPQSWFEPAMPDKPSRLNEPQPEPLDFGVSPANCEKATRWAMDPCWDLNEQSEFEEFVRAAKNYWERSGARLSEIDSWESERKAQRRKQWPYAWADAMLQERSK